MRFATVMVPGERCTCAWSEKIHYDLSSTCERLLVMSKIQKMLLTPALLVY